jgi:organic hydroperoxide reductase OsmC/OhrA
VTGEIGKDGSVLVIRRIHVRYRLQAEPESRPIIERVHGMHARHCPVARSIEGCIEIGTEIELI